MLQISKFLVFVFFALVVFEFQSDAKSKSPKPATSEAQSQTQKRLPAYLDSKADIENRIQDLLPRLSLKEKVGMVSGQGGKGFETGGVPRLKIPSLKMTDGPSGVRWGKSTAFPAEILWASSFDPALVREIGTAVAQETKAEGRDMILGPAMNISRVPVNGRGFEYLGEDPFLSAALAREYVIGAQSEKVIATAKHWALNDQEFRRDEINVRADERTMNEIYFPPFKASVEAGVLSVMSAYNQVNGFFASENDELINRVLKGRWNFQGFVVSDWISTHSTVGITNAGLDIDMPRGKFFGKKLLKAIAEKKVDEKELDKKVQRILRAMFAIGLMDEAEPPRPETSVVNGPEHRRLALKAAQEGIVLLKNENHILPLGPHVSRIAIIGPNANVLRYLGGGSAHLTPVQAISPLEALRSRLAAQSDRKVFLDFVDENADEAFQTAVGNARRADVVLFFGGLSPHLESEGDDLAGMDLPPAQTKLLTAVAAANPKTVFILNSGNPVVVKPWMDQIQGFVQSWYPGQEGGFAIADLLLGNVNPSGKLPVSFPVRWEDASGYQSYTSKTDETINYTEGIFVGYRHFDTHKVAPMFPFGFGLSYTKFDYQKLDVQVKEAQAANAKVEVSFVVKNIGDRDGTEIAQLYVESDTPQISRALQELKSFARTGLKKGESKKVTFTLGADAFRYYDSAAHGWNVLPGHYKIKIGASSRDTRLAQAIELR